MKISTPRRKTDRAAAFRLPGRQKERSADRTTMTPASHRKSGAPNPPRTMIRRKASVDRAAFAVQASKVCAMSMIRTATPRR